MKLIKWLKENIFYIEIWKKEIRRELKFERTNKKEEYLKCWYYKKTGLKLDLDNPKTFTEKQQVLKLQNDNYIKTYCTDKYLVRSFIKNTIGEDFLIPIIKNNGKEYFYNAMEINFEELPNSFVIQCNHGAHMTHIVRSKDKLGKKGFFKLQKKLNKELQINYAYCHGYEMQYKNIKPCIFITQYLANSNDLPDYKFFCFNGDMKYFSVDTNRFNNHKRTIFNKNYEMTYFQCPEYKMIDMKLDVNVLDKMQKITSELSLYFDFVRVDLYAVGEKIYFGELTFSSASGIAILNPYESNLDMAKYIDFSKIWKATKNPYEKI